LTNAELIARARRSATSAKLLFDAGDLNGACNRAYYAMFDAARAALLASKEPVKSEVIKTHSGLIAAFSLHLIKPGRIPMQYGKSLRQMDQIRLIADYSDEEVDRETASSAIEQADHFVDVVSSYLADIGVDKPDEFGAEAARRVFKHTEW
jgi:uncharacterized protein (UPF0332 family)